MRKIAIVGIGQTSVGEHYERSMRQLAANAVLSALKDSRRARVDGLFAGNMLSGPLNRQSQLGTLLADWAGLRGVEACKVETACSSGASALRAAIFAVGSGEMDCAVAVGVEKMTDSDSRAVTASLATAADSDWEGEQGVTFVAINALIMRRYMHEHGWKRMDFAPFAINAHANAVHNPCARLPEPITETEYAEARMVADPISLMDASPIGDGAAAVVIMAADPTRVVRRSPITIEASAVATDTISVHDRKDPLWLEAAHRSAKMAYRQAGIDPYDVDLFELHDAFSIMALLSLEACGFADRGQGPRLGLDGEICLHGKIPICTLGGLKARGHPVGATGIYQIVELVRQLRGQAGGAQVEGARIGMAQNIGGSGATVVTHILKSEASL